jgi:ABC-type spermidine/putrescine transport system permease subunit II
LGIKARIFRRRPISAPRYKFDEIAVTFFLAGSDTTTLPLWILGALRRTRDVPEVNAVATVVLAISLPMIAAAAYLMRDVGAGFSSRE